MNMPLNRATLTVAGGLLLLGGTLIVADGTRFSDFTPLTSSAGPTTDESAPITLGNPAFHQESIADRNTQLAANIPNSGSWDMNTVNETGPHKGRFLFAVFESTAGVQRHDLLAGVTDTIWFSPTPTSSIRFDPSFWTPWGTLITGQEEWCTAVAGCTTNIYGRLFELRNPIDAPPILKPVTTASNINADFVHRNVIPRAAHEGMQFDKAGNFYFIDELNGGNIYKFTSAANWGDVKSGKADYFAGGQSFVMRVGDEHIRRHGRVHLGSVHGCQRRRSARSTHRHGPERDYVGRCAQHHQPAGIQGNRLQSTRGHPDPDSERCRLSVCGDDRHA